MDLHSMTTQELRSFLGSGNQADSMALVEAKQLLELRRTGKARSPSAEYGPVRPPVGPKKKKKHILSGYGSAANPVHLNIEILEGPEHEDAKQQIRDQVEDMLADIRRQHQKQELLRVKAIAAEATKEPRSRSQPQVTMVLDVEEDGEEGEVIGMVQPGQYNYPVNQGRGSTKTTPRWQIKEGKNYHNPPVDEKRKYVKSNKVPQARVIVPESTWRFLARKGDRPLEMEDLLSHNQIKAPDFDWRWYSVLWEWALRTDGSMRKKSLFDDGGYTKETKDFTDEDMSILTYAPRRVLGDTLPIIEQLPSQVEINKGNHDMNWDPALLALQYLYDDEALTKSDLATFKHHDCSPHITKYHMLLTRVAALNHRIVGHKDPDFGSSLFLKEIQKRIGHNHESSKEVNHYNLEPDDFLYDMENLRVKFANEFEAKMRADPNSLIARRTNSSRSYGQPKYEDRYDDRERSRKRGDDDDSRSRRSGSVSSKRARY